MHQHVMPSPVTATAILLSICVAMQSADLLQAVWRCMTAHVRCWGRAGGLAGVTRRPLATRSSFVVTNSHISMTAPLTTVNPDHNRGLYAAPELGESPIPSPPACIFVLLGSRVGSVARPTKFALSHRLCWCWHVYLFSCVTSILHCSIGLVTWPCSMPPTKHTNQAGLPIPGTLHNQ